MQRREFLKTLGAGTAAVAGPAWLRAVQAAAASAPAARPNILFILADDYGLDGVGCYGSDRFKTPNLDTLAQTGLRFETCYSTPLCGPTRCLFITGRYGFRTGGLSNGSAGRPAAADEPSVAKTLKAAGYATAQVGKWRQMGGTPADWGFDEYLTDPTASGWFWAKGYTRNGQAVQVEKEVYYPDVMFEFAADFMKRHREGPFFLYFAEHLVHGPILKTPDSKDGGNFYADNVAYLDKQVGRLVAELDRLGLRQKTLVLFSADNGTAGRSATIGGRAINGAKGSMLEGGARVALIANWKGTAPEGKVVKDLVDFSDLHATFADLAGAALPEGVTLDGRSFAPQLKGQAGRPRDWIFVQLGAKWYVREPLWKLNESGELFDMKDAPFVEKPAPADAPDAEAAAARKRLQAVLDGLNPAAGKTDAGRAPNTGKPRPKKDRKKQPAAVT